MVLLAAKTNGLDPQTHIYTYIYIYKHIYTYIYISQVNYLCSVIIDDTVLNDNTRFILRENTTAVSEELFSFLSHTISFFYP